MGKINIIQQFSEQLDDTLSTVESIVNEYTEELDDCIYNIESLLYRNEDIPAQQLNYYIAYIPTLLYDLTTRLQGLGIKQDAAKMQRKDKYNSSYQQIDKGTVAHKTTLAQQQCQDEQMIEDVFTRAYKICEDKMEKAEMLHGSLKKVLQWKLTELEITRTGGR